MTNVGMLIRQERERRGLSQEQLARILHIDRSTISRIETNTQVATHDLLEEIVEALRSPKLRLEILGGAIPCMYLNNLDYHPLAIQQTAIKELKEAVQELESLNLLNKLRPDDLTEREKDKMLNETMANLQDANACIDLVLMTLSEQYDISLAELEKISKKRMIEKGYMVEAAS
ncbi:helix-turn-helix domain-containing protein [Iocasia frigidifontis]|uniref:Helix-turn-helix domain-containing protein n=1 Tax=Iocasia fonsfrigidae TaxID=2682810 RepID=A0A8A7K4A3_9FIRM|nr:helix-turn-helix transcriptional regulator [Iocasia fonsfrigidae]QTL96526.1 helix-turn-helix domain-containing protein [Iocasia fonsfrigidae]